MTMLFAGDPHRNFSPIIRACLARSAGSLILLGDLDCDRKFSEIFAAVLQAGWRAHWILGNHDCETETAFDNLAGAHPDGDLGWRVTDIDGVKIAGLPGVFKPSIWYPRADDGATTIDPPRYHNRAAFLAEPKIQRWRDGLPLWHRDSIFPDDVARLARQRFDILVSHEAPSCHRHGFAVIDELAWAGGARLIVHGHHHDSYTATLPNGIKVRGLGLAEPWSLAD
jgi:calcineurin-like phosphoesterase family protein